MVYKLNSAVWSAELNLFGGTMQKLCNVRVVLFAT